MTQTIQQKDPFWSHPIRTSKGGGTKCTTCEQRTNCHDCCTCVWPYVCTTYNLQCVDTTILNANPVLGAVQWSCANNRYDLSVDCDGYYTDIFMSYVKVSGSCYAKLESETLGFYGSGAILMPFSTTSNCRCPVWDFNLGDSQSIQIRPYQMVSVGNQRCINRGPDDCTYGRCLPRYLCASIYTTARPDEPYGTVLSWYENDRVTVTGCCNGNTLPNVLLARFVNFSDDCTCIAPQKIASIYWPAEHAGNQFTDAGSIVHLRHKIATTGDYYVNNYPNVPSGSNVWQSYGYFNGSGDLVRLCPQSSCSTASPSGTGYSPPSICGRMLLWYDGSTASWKTATEIINTTAADAAFNTDYLTKPYDPADAYSNVNVLDSTILSCNPFHIKTDQFNEPTHCYDNYGNQTDGTSTLQIHLQEFIGWTGVNPIESGKKITMYSEVVTVAGPIQSVPDCTAKLHLQENAEFDSFKNRSDPYQVGREWPSYVMDGSRFVMGSFVGLCENEQITAIDVIAQPCGGCPTIPTEDPYAIDVLVDCCVNRIPKTLTATIVAVNNCPAADGDTFSVTWDASQDAWIGTYNGYSCGFCIKLTCGGFIGGVPIWRFYISYDCSTYSLVTVSSQQCDPFLLQTVDFAPPPCVCQPVGTPSQMIHIIISE